jgi:hypothetical protein
MNSGVDVIGDIHGFAIELRSLLDKLGYEKRGGIYKHAHRTAVFTGDFIDRGPENLEVVRIVRSMVDIGAARAIMGNHEYNALGFHSVDWENERSFLREHLQKNINQHWTFLEEKTVYPWEAGKALEWFSTLPLYIEEEGARFVHAAWHQPTIETIKSSLNDDQTMSDDFFRRSFVKGTEEHKAIEILLKGPEFELPPGVAPFKDVEGNSRNKIRLAWWKKPGATPVEAAVEFPGNGKSLAEALPGEVFDGFDAHAPGPVTFVGHYWLKGTPKPLSPRVACVDYSVAAGGPRGGGRLCCYRWDGENKLIAENFVTVPRFDAY